MAAPIVVATKPEAQPAAPPAATQKSHGETLAPQPPVHHRTADASAPRRPADTRRRADVAASDSGVTAATQGAAEPRASSQPAGIPAAPAKADAVVQQTLTIARDGAWLDRLARDIASAGNGGDLQFKLDPQHLGSLSVAITQGTDGASIRLTADNDATRNLLLDAQPKLLAEARAQGLRVSDTHVDLNQNQTQSQNQGQSQQNQQGQHQAQAQTANQDLSRWAQGGSNQNGGTQNGQNRQSSPGHQPFVSNLGRKAEADSESSDGDSGALYA
jgi:flagellar hook-length control protein FliK